MEILKARGLSFTYPDSAVRAVDEVSFEVRRGELVVLCGATGCGKSTLLRLLKRELTPLGELEGRVLYNGIDRDELDPRRAAFSVGFVAQDVRRQTVCDKVWHELAFGLENAGADRNTISRRIAEICGYFGMEKDYEKDVASLSGGQAQLLNLASVMVCDPKILILDEPTSQLDPIAADDFINILKKLNDELSLTVIIAEHRLERLIPICDKMLVMEKGRLIHCGEPRQVVKKLADSALLPSLPAPIRLAHMLGEHSNVPISVGEGRELIEREYKNDIVSLPQKKYEHSDRLALECSDVCFGYEKGSPDILGELSLKVYENEIFCILGGNGSGKTTALRVFLGLLKPYTGKIKLFGKNIKDYKNGSLYGGCAAYLPQDVQTLFLKNTVRAELEEVGASIAELSDDLIPLLECHPYDLSGGQQQLVALAKVLAKKPRIIFMDEITKGLDGEKKSALAERLRELKKSTTVVLVTHDIEFAASCADRIGMFFHGGIASTGTPDEFFSENSFYTTSASRMSRGYYERAVSVESLAKLCKANGKKLQAPTP